ncbi:MAG: cohesin domain-containing protein [Candidatus Omnitrophica bacterium]|nr:cohesin domain-containing protein [Candidatus Omnitrophota bacterium]
MKKLILAFLAMTGYIFGASLQIPSITINNPQSQPFIDVNVYFSSEKEFAGYQITIQYNQQILKLMDVQKGQDVSHFTVMTNTNTPGLIRIAGFNPTLSGVFGNGILAVLRFQIINPGYSSLVISSAKLSDPKGYAIPCSSSSGSIKAGETQQPEKPPIKPQPEETKTKARTVPVPTGEPRPKPPLDSPQIPMVSETTDTFDIDEFLMTMEKTLEPKETEKSLYQQKPSNSVILLVLSEYGNPVPPAGITTFSKGDRIECRVETEILLNDMEKVVCIGCEGKGSAYNTKTNMVSFTIEKDSKIVWKWKKIPVEAGITIETQSTVNIASDRNQFSIPLRIRFLGGLDRPVYITAKSQDFDAVFDETCLTPEKKETSVFIKAKDTLKSGKYQLTIFAESSDEKIGTKREIEIIVHATAMLGDAIVDESTKTISIPLIIKGNIKNISSFEMILNSDPNLKLSAIEPPKNAKVLSGHSQKGNLLKISGGIVPAIETSDGKIFNIIFSYFKKQDINTIKLLRCSLWDDKGRPLPIYLQ